VAVRAPGGAFPFGLGWQTLARPARIVRRIKPTHLDDRILLKTLGEDLVLPIGRYAVACSIAKLLVFLIRHLTLVDVEGLDPHSVHRFKGISRFVRSKRYVAF